MIVHHNVLSDEALDFIALAVRESSLVDEKESKVLMIHVMIDSNIFKTFMAVETTIVETG